MDSKLRIEKFNDINIVCRNGDIGVAKEVFYEDPYKIKDIVKDGSIVIDIGAHIGTFALRCAIEKDCTIYAYEPCDESYKILLENIHINNLENKIMAYNNAVCGKNEIRDFRVSTEHYAGSSFHMEYKPYYITKVKCITLREIFEDNNIKKCDLLKMDCEEEEKYILLNENTEIILDRIDKIVLEYHRMIHGKEIADYLKRMKFTVYPNELLPVERSILYATR